MTNTCPQCANPIPDDGPLGLCPQCMLAVGGADSNAASASRADGSDAPPTPEEIQPLFPHLQIVRLIGQGGMGAVYEARQRGLGRTVALKLLWAPKRYDAAFEQRFAREGQALAQLSHDNIVTVHDAGKSGTYYWLVMEYVDGANLRELLERGRLAPAEALPMVTQICSALEYAHQQGIVHRDIKPENILIGADGRLKVADFGLAKMLASDRSDPKLTESFLRLGTPHYMAPEQHETPKDVDHRADIYSLGVLLYELLTGELPIGKFLLPSRMADVDPRLDGVVAKAMQKAPGRRYQAISDVRRAVQGIVGSRGVMRNNPRRSARMQIPHWSTLVAFALGAIAISLIAWQFVDSSANATDGRLSVEERFAAGRELIRSSHSMQAGIDQLEAVYQQEPDRAGLRDLLGKALTANAENLLKQYQFKDAVRAARRAYHLVPSTTGKALLDVAEQEAQNELRTFVRITEPTRLDTLKATKVEIRGTVPQVLKGALSIAGEPVVVVDGQFRHSVKGLREGRNELLLSATEADGLTISAPLIFTVDTAPPTLTFDVPQEGAVVSTPLVLTGTVIDTSAVEVKIGETRATLNEQDEWTVTLDDLDDGDTTIELIAVDASGRSTKVSRQLTIDNTPPVIAPQSGSAEFITKHSGVSVLINVSDPNLKSVAIDGRDSPLNGDAPMSVFVGAGDSDRESKTTTVTAFDKAGNQSSVALVGIRDTIQPVVELSASVVDLFPGTQFTILGRCEDDSPCEVLHAGGTYEVNEGAFESPTITVPIEWTAGTEFAVDLELRDSAGNSTRSTFARVVHEPCSTCKLIEGVRGLCNACDGTGSRERRCDNGCKNGISIDPCGGCRGRGKQVCGVCDGNGKLPAIPCGNCRSGRQTCVNCDGARKTLQSCRPCDGYGTVFAGVRGTVTCGNCKGTKKANYDCPGCSGKGTTDCSHCIDGSFKPQCLECSRGYLDAACPAGCEKGRVSTPCSKCNSSGRLQRDCSTCSGSGQCKQCKGTGHADAKLISARRGSVKAIPRPESDAGKGENKEHSKRALGAPAASPPRLASDASVAVLTTVRGSLEFCAPVAGFWRSSGEITSGVTGAAITRSGGGVFEIVALEGNRLIHFRSIDGKSWNRGATITEGATGPGAITVGKRGNLLVVVPEHDGLIHYWSTPGEPWNRAQIVTSSATSGASITLGPGGNLEVLALEGNTLVHYWTTPGGPTWSRTGAITDRATAVGSIVRGTAAGNFVVVVPEGSDLVTYWARPGKSWNRSEVITSKASGAASIICSSNGRLEVVVPEGNLLVHYWVDPGQAWVRGGEVMASDGKFAAIVVVSE